MPPSDEGIRSQPALSPSHCAASRGLRFLTECRTRKWFGWRGCQVVRLSDCSEVRTCKSAQLRVFSEHFPGSFWHRSCL